MVSEPSAPGWYPDPQDGRRLRWWSGRAWTDRWQDRQPPQAPAPEPSRRLPTRGAAAVPGDDTPIPLDLSGGPRSGSPRPSSGVAAGPYGAPVSLVDAVVDGFRRMFAWRGRSSRGAFWWLWLLGVVVSITSGAWDAYVLARFPDWIELPYFDPTIPAYIDVIALLLIPVSIAVSIAIVGAGVRRMHDVGRSGWFILVPFYNFYLAVQPSQSLQNRWG